MKKTELAEETLVVFFERYNLQMPTWWRLLSGTSTNTLKLIFKNSNLNSSKINKWRKKGRGGRGKKVCGF